MPDPARDRRVPEVAISNTSTLVTHTGSWKYIRPEYHDRVAPCNQGCPVGIDIEGYMALLRDGKVDAAADLLLRENPMPATTGRVCHHPCELACNRREFDTAVSIHAVERMLGDLVLEREPSEPGEPLHDASVAIVGSGPAGLACAYHLARLGYPVTVFEAAAEPGGMLRLGIPEFRLPRAVLDREIERIRRVGVTIHCGVRVGTEDLPWGSLLGRFDATLLASGAHVSKPLGVTGEAAAAVRSGLDFLKDVNRGARPHLGDSVVTVGGGNTAIDCARTALRLGAASTILYRRTRAEMPAIAQEIDEAEREGVRFVFLAAPAAFAFDGERLRALECIRMRLGSPDASGRRRPIATDERFTLPADTVLTAIGEAVDLEGLPVTGTDSAIPTDAWGQTARAGVFAGGDLAEQPRSVADALGAGKRAAIGIDRFLRARSGEPVGERAADALRLGPRGNLSITAWRGDDPVARVAPLGDVVPYEDLNPAHFEHVTRYEDRALRVAEALGGFAEVNAGLDRHAGLAEATRCFNCGVCNQCELCLIFCPDVAIARRNGHGFTVDLEYCKGCGVCVAECPRGAMVLTREGLS
jgi:NADPH-dependent glutamate synthase beta subunit-like oxidoreductase